MSKIPSEKNSLSLKVQRLHGGGGELMAPSEPHHSKGIRHSAKPLLVFWFGVLGLAALLLIFGERFHGLVFGPKAVMQKAETLAALRIDLLKSIESEKRAVMADTDEASLRFAEESRLASDSAEMERVRLAELIRLHPVEDESRILSEFDTAWENFRALDRQLLELAVQNTNLKARVLSFGKATETLHLFRAALDRLTQGVNNFEAFRLASNALAAVLTIQTLHAPHIASADDGEMERIEEAIRAQGEVVRRCLDQLARIVPADSRKNIAEAQTLFTEYEAITQRVIELSRRNTNVTSLELSLNRKMKMTTQCEVILNKLQEAIQGREFKATR